MDEVGGPTILATFTVIAALLPMAFVTGLMGPYMRPIPINASAGMLLSLPIALVVTPWLQLKLLSRHAPAAAHARAADSAGPAALHRLFTRVAAVRSCDGEGSRRRRLLFGAMLLLVVLSAGLAVLRVVVLKMLPFDNKSEIQVVVDLPEGSTLEQTNALLMEVAQQVAPVPEVVDFQGYAGTSAPVNFNGLVRQYFLRSGSNVGDLQVNLVDKHHRERQSHDIARELRPRLADACNASRRQPQGGGGAARSAGACRRWSPKSTARTTRARAKLGVALQERFKATDGIVDTDTSVESTAPHEMLVVDRARAARLGVSQAAIAASAQPSAWAGAMPPGSRMAVRAIRTPVRLRLARCGPGAAGTIARAARARARAASWCHCPNW